MIIFIGGLPGSGREFLAKSLAADLGFYYYDRINDFRMLLPPRSKWTAFSDGYLEHIAKIISDELPLVSKMHGDLVVIGTLQRRRSREMLLEQGRRLGPVLVVWVESSDETSEVILRGRGMSDAAVRSRMRLRSEMQKEFQPITAPHITYTNKGESQEDAADFCEFVRKSMAAR